MLVINYKLETLFTTIYDVNVASFVSEAHIEARGDGFNYVKLRAELDATLNA